MNDNKLIAVVLVATVGLIGGGMLLASYLNKQPTVAAETGAQAKTSQTTRDWGEIPINGGKVTANFPITNGGSGKLKLYNGTTSCACTTAQLKRGTNVSPMFGMHSQTAAVFEVPPGETAVLEVIFDPAFHGPSGLGPITRQATIQTNNPQQPQLSFETTATVIK